MGSKKGQKHSPRTKAEATPHGEDSKLSPNSLRGVLTDVRNTYNNGQGVTEDAFMKEIGTRFFGGNKRYGRLGPGKIFQATEDGNSHLYWWQLEAYADVTNTVTSALILVARIRYQVREKEYEQGRAILRGMRALIDQLEAYLDRRRQIETTDVFKLLRTFRAAAKSANDEIAI